MRWLILALLATTVPAPVLPNPPAEAPAAPTRIEIVGDLATADRIAVIVPGVATTPENFDRGLGGVLRRSPAWQAHQLHAAAAPSTAVVAWLGYEPPAGVGLAAARSEAAVAGARALVRFIEELPGDGTVTVIGHSYGSLVWAYAAPELPPRVIDLVAIGSPGLDVPRASALGTTARVWAGRAPGDWTRWLPSVRLFGLGHGADPVAEGFGAYPLDVADATGHDGYFQPSSRSLAGLAAVASGSHGARGAD